MAAPSIEVHNVGPVEEFAYELSAPGLHILAGSQGKGKTTILRTVELATGGKPDVKPTRRDGAKRGTARVAGATVRIMQQTRHEGTLEVADNSSLSLGDLHTPKFQNAQTRDRHRIKTLVRLCGVEANAALFHELFDSPERFDEIVPVDVLKTDDLVEMAGRVKRAIEKHAVDIERQHETEAANARVQAQQFEGVDLTQPSGEAELSAAWERAVEERARLKALREAAEQTEATKVAAREKLTELEAKGGQSAADTKAKLDAADKSERDAQSEVRRLEAELAEAKRKLGDATSAADLAATAHREAQEREQDIAELREQLEATVDNPTDDALAVAEEAVTRAAIADDTGSTVRRAKAAREQYEKHQANADQLEEEATRLRDAAKATAEVLTEAIARIPNCPLRVEFDNESNPRLVLATDRSDAEPFDELSDGERWPIIIGIAAEQNRLIVLPQAAYGELSQSTRALVDGLAKQHNCYVLTAVADDGPLRGMPFSSGQV